MISTSTVPSQEKLAGALAYVFFFFPMILGTKTEFTMFHSKQSFGLFLVLVIGKVLSVIPLVGGTLFWMISLIIVILDLIFGYKAYLGEKSVISEPLLEKTNLCINTIGLNNFFSKK